MDNHVGSKATQVKEFYCILINSSFSLLEIDKLLFQLPQSYLWKEPFIEDSSKIFPINWLLQPISFNLPPCSSNFHRLNFDKVHYVYIWNSGSLQQVFYLNQPLFSFQEVVGGRCKKSEMFPTYYGRRALACCITSIIPAHNVSFCCCWASIIQKNISIMSATSISEEFEVDPFPLRRYILLKKIKEWN